MIQLFFQAGCPSQEKHMSKRKIASHAQVAFALGLLGTTMVLTAGCSFSELLAGLTGSTPTGSAAQVAAKAEEVALDIGGPNGFGGSMMSGYRAGMPAHAGFHGMGNLAGDGAQMMV